MAKKPKRIKVVAGNGGRKMRLPPRAKQPSIERKRDKTGRFA